MPYICVGLKQTKTYRGTPLPFCVPALLHSKVFGPSALNVWRRGTLPLASTGRNLWPSAHSAGKNV